MTSNLGTEILSSLPEDEPIETVSGQVMDVVRSSFRPEFLNRIDEIVLFNRLAREHMARIVDIQLSGLLCLLADRKIVIELDEAARRWLADGGFDPVYGARPLRRVIQRSLQNPLANLILDGKINDGDVVHVSATSDGLIIDGEVVEAAAA